MRFRRARSTSTSSTKTTTAGMGFGYSFVESSPEASSFGVEETSGPRSQTSLGSPLLRASRSPSSCESTTLPEAESEARWMPEPKGECGEEEWGSHFIHSQPSTRSAEVRHVTMTSAGEYCAANCAAIAPRACLRMSAGPHRPKPPEARRSATRGTCVTREYSSASARTLAMASGSPER